MGLRQKYVSSIYVHSNVSKRVRNTLRNLINNYQDGMFILNIGSGSEVKRRWSNVKNLDLIAGPNVDYVASAENIPIGDNSVDLIISQETFEHIASPQAAIQECYRILKPGGMIYLQVPFIIGYHPGPTDFWRFTKEGIVELLENVGFEIHQLEITVAGATGFYRVAVEFLAVLFSGPIQMAYIPMKGLFALLLYPVKWLDPWFMASNQRHRIPGGYFAVAMKLEVSNINRT